MNRPMMMFALAAIAALSGSGCVLPPAAPATISWRSQAKESEVRSLEGKVALALDGRDMRKNDLGLVAVKGWEGLPARRFWYWWDSALGKQRVEVIFLDPDVKKAADWIGNATVDVFGSYRHDQALNLCERIRKQSQFYFPVAGFLDEQEGGLYVFKDGIAATFKPGTTMGAAMSGFTVKPSTRITPDLITAALAQPDDAVGGTGWQGRPISVAMEEFRYGKRRPSEKHAGERWDRVLLREAYKKAWVSDRNALITQFLRVYRDTPFKEWPK